MERKLYPLKCQAKFGELLDRHYREVKEAKEAGVKVAWCVASVPTDIVRAFGYLPVYPETHATTCGGRAVGTELCRVAEGHGYSEELCSLARADLGSCFTKGEGSPVGGLPPPDLLVSPTWCHTHIKWFGAVGRFYDVPMLLLDIPYSHDGLGEEEIGAAARYVKEQLMEQIVFLESLTGRRLNWDRLQECVHNTGTAARLFKEIVGMARHVPAPFTAFDACLHLGALINLRGSPEAVEYYRELKEEVAERVREGFSAIGEERFRLYWDGIPIWFRLGGVARKFAAYGASFPLAYLPFLHLDAFSPLDPDRPLESMAEAQVRHFLNRGTAAKAERLAAMLRDYSIDGLVMQVSRTCKPFIADQMGLLREVRKRTELPSVVIEGDMVDSRFFSEPESHSRIESFMEMLSQKLKR